MKAASGNERVHDKKKLPTSALGKRARKLDPDLMSERSIRTIKDKNMNRTHFLSKLLDLCASYNPVWMILMTFVTYNGVLIWRRLLSAARREWWNGATGFAIPGSVFDPLSASAFDKPRSATDDAAVALPMFKKKNVFTFLLNQEDTCPCLWPYASQKALP